MKQKLQTLKGFRDFLPEEKRKRDFVMGKIRETFEIYGFEPLETPTLEYASLLLGKYGDEVDKLLYTFEDRGGRQVGLRYDQTVPTSRMLVQYKEELPKYFRRYQMQNVFRADKPQKGRYREFTQCDIDIFGSTSPLADAEILAATYFAYKNIGFKEIFFNINSRADIRNIMDTFSTYDLRGKKDQQSPMIWKKRVNEFLQSVDKLEKKSEKEIIDELVGKKFPRDYVVEILNTLKERSNKVYMSPELKKVVSLAQNLGVPNDVFKYSPLMVRGLDYYTGMIFEVLIPQYKVGSVGGGGRYDELINDLSGVNVPAVGIAFGFDRMVEAADELELIPRDNIGTQVMVTIFNEDLVEKSLQVANKLRASEIKTEVYPNPDKLSTQLKEANNKSVPYVVIIGPDEVEKNEVRLKDMENKTEEVLKLDQVISRLRL